MPEITAEQLAERKRRVCEEMGPNSFVASLTGEQWDHIIACLREHEERAATVKETETVPVMEWRPARFNGEILYVGNEWVGSIYQIDYVWQANSAKSPNPNIGLFHDVYAAKAAVEKAVRG